MFAFLTVQITSGAFRKQPTFMSVCLFLNKHGFLVLNWIILTGF
jgi:hypothetical protein